MTGKKEMKEKSKNNQRNDTQTNKKDGNRRYNYKK